MVDTLLRITRRIHKTSILDFTWYIFKFQKLKTLLTDTYLRYVLFYKSAHFVVLFLIWYKKKKLLPFFTLKRFFIIYYTFWLLFRWYLRLVNLVLFNNSRTRKITGCLVRALHTSWHAFSCVAERHLTGCISREDLFARGGLDSYRAEQNGEHAGRIYHAVYLSLRATTTDIVNRSGKWSKRLAEPCQRNRITSTDRPRLSESPLQWRRGINAIAEQFLFDNVW